MSARMVAQPTSAARSLAKRVGVALALCALVTGLWATSVLPPGVRWRHAAAASLTLGWLLASGPLSGLRGKLLLLVASLALSLIAGELVLRQALRDVLVYGPHQRFLRRWPALPALLRYEPNARFVGETFGDLAAMLPDASLRQRRTVMFETDALGFRNTPPAPRGEYDVLILGDSFGTGDGTSQESTWSSLLQSRHGLRVYNLSMPGIGPWHGYASLLGEHGRLRRSSRCVVLLAFFAGNDLDDAYGSLDPAALAPRPGPVRAAAAWLFTLRERAALQRLLMLALRGQESEVLVRPFPGGPMLFFGDYVRRRRRTEAMLLAHPNLGALSATLQALRDLAGSLRAGFRVVLFPAKAEVYSWVLDPADAGSSRVEPSPLGRVLGRLCAERSIPFADLTRAFVERARGRPAGEAEPLYWRDDSHFSPVGHELAGWELAGGLLADLAAAQPRQAPRAAAAAPARRE
jgi:hypothetical protein